MRVAMIRPIVRAAAALALVGAVVGVLGGTASASGHVTIKASPGGNPSGVVCNTYSGNVNSCNLPAAIARADALFSEGDTSVTIKAHGGTYTTPINVNHSNITIQGVGHHAVIEPTSTLAEASVEDSVQQNVLVNVASDVNTVLLKNLTVNGANAQSSFTACSQDYVGVYFGDSSGTLNKVTVENVQQPAADFGCQPGANGDVYAVTCTTSEPGAPASCPTANGTSAVTLTKVTLESYDKNGLTCDGAGTSCTATHTTVTGSGVLDDQAQNGVQIAYGATATMTSSTVSGDAYNCNGVVDSACYSASGILPYEDGGVTLTGDTVTTSDVGIAPVEDAGTVNITGDTVTNGTDADVDSAQGIEPVEDGYATAVNITGNTITGNDGGGIFNYASGPEVTESGNTIENDSASETIETCTSAGPPPSGCTTTTAVVGGGVINYGTTGGTVGPSNLLESDTAGGVIDQGATGGTIGGGAGNTISNDANGGVELDQSTDVTVSNNTMSSDAAGAVLGEAAPGSPDSGNVVSGNTVSGSSGAGVELQLDGGYTIENNTVSGLGEGGEGFILVGSNDNTVSLNTVSSSAAGIIVTGNNLTGPSTNNTVSNNNFSSNLLGGAAADGAGSPESWNRPGEGDQGIQGTTFFQSSVAVAAGPIGDGSPSDAVEVDTPAGMGGVTGAYAGTAEYLAEAGAICGVSAVPVDNQGGNLYACSDGAGDIYLFGVVGTAITAGNGEATGDSSESGEPGCEASPPSNTGAPSCTGSVLGLSDLPSYETVTEGNTFTDNVWNNETIVGAIDGSGPNGELAAGSPTFADGDGNASIENTWTGNTGSPANSPANPSTADPAQGS